MTAEEIPNHLLIDELQNQLNTRTAELVVALARVRARDDRIRSLQDRVNELIDQRASDPEEKHGPAV